MAKTATTGKAARPPRPLVAAGAETSPRGRVRKTASAPRDNDTAELAQLVGRNLHRLRANRGHSLSALAKLSGVSRAMLGQIELGRSVPTIGLLWKVARVLDVPFSALTGDVDTSGTVVLRAGEAKLLSSRDGSFTSRALFPFDNARRVEFYKLTLAPYATENAVAHPPGTLENLAVIAGEVEIGVAGERHRLKAEDAILFTADLPHHYRNCGGKPATMYLVMTYAERIG